MSDEKLIYTCGPAFPVNSPNGDYPGMTLRDYFAAKAMQATQISEVMEAFRRNDYDGRQSHNTYAPINTCEELAEEAYRIADAMLKARHQ